MSEPLFFDDLEVGMSFTTAARAVDEQMLGTFVELSGDRNPLHVDEEFARASGFERRLVHGALVFAVATGLRQQTGLFAGSMLAMLELRSWRFVAPVFLGDSITVATTIAQLRSTSSPSRGVVIQQVDVHNQSHTLVQSGELVSLFAVRAPAAAVNA